MLFSVTAPKEIFPLSLHDALPIFALQQVAHQLAQAILVVDQQHLRCGLAVRAAAAALRRARSEEHTSELQSRVDLVCRLLLEKKNIAEDLSVVKQYINLG